MHYNDSFYWAAARTFYSSKVLRSLFHETLLKWQIIRIKLDANKAVWTNGFARMRIRREHVVWMSEDISIVRKTRKSMIHGTGWGITEYYNLEKYYIWTGPIRYSDIIRDRKKPRPAVPEDCNRTLGSLRSLITHTHTVWPARPPSVAHTLYYHRANIGIQLTNVNFYNSKRFFRSTHPTHLLLPMVFYYSSQFLT